MDRIGWIYTRKAGGFARQGKGVTAYVIVCRTNLNFRLIFENGGGIIQHIVKGENYVEVIL